MITDSYAIALTLLIMARTPVMKQDEPSLITLSL